MEIIFANVSLWQL